MLSLRRRLVLAHLGAVLAIVAAAALLGWWQLSLSVRGQLDGALLALAETEAVMLVETKGQPIHIHEAAPGTAPPSLVRLDRLVQIVDGSGKVLSRSANLGVASLPAPAELLEQLAEGQVVYQTLPHVSEEPLRMVSVPARVGGRLFGVQVAGSLDDANHLLHSAVLLFTGLGAALLAAVGAVGMVLARKIFGAVDDIALKARRIGEANLDERLPHSGEDDEIGHLVGTLNDMLDRLEQTFEVQRRFTADASHELRSPLSRLRTEIEVTLRRPRDAADYVATLRSCLEEVGRMTSLVEELLMLARLDAGQEHAPPEPVALDVLAEEVRQRLAAAAREREVRVLLETGEPVSARVAHGPAILVLANLLDNAIKFSPRGAQVIVRAGREGDAASLSVADEGPGIPGEELPRLFDRFYRGAGARAESVEGIGLGLALAQSVARAYGGRVSAANRPGGGAVFTVVFPLAG